MKKTKKGPPSPKVLLEWFMSKDSSTLGMGTNTFSAYATVLRRFASLTETEDKPLTKEAIDEISKKVNVGVSEETACAYKRRIATAVLLYNGIHVIRRHFEPCQGSEGAPYRFPLRDGSTYAVFSVPPDLTERDVERIHTILKALVMPENH